jgi:MFS family permease
MSTHNIKLWDTGYEIKAVTLLSLGFGLVGLDRFMILPMFPAIMKDLHLGYQNLGEITGILSITWGIAALFTGRISDLLGRRKVVLAAIVIFSLLVGVSGLATSLITLLMVRGLMGFADGAYTPPSIVATLEASKPTRHGLNLGIEQMMLPLFGLALAPLIVTQLLQDVSWRWIFVMVTPFGLLLAALMFFILRAPSEIAAVDTVVHYTSAHKLTDLFQYRNIIHNMIGMLCWLTCLIVTSAMLPSYLIDYLHLSLPQMGFVLSAIGFGGSAGCVIMPMISDRIGRKPMMLISTAGAALSLLAFMKVGPSPVILFSLLLLTHFFNFSLITLTVGPLSAESVPTKLMASASGLVVCTGELFGGGVAPIIAGFVAENFGIQYILHLAVAGLCVGFLNCCFLRETAPRRLRDVVISNASQDLARGT